MSEVKQRFYGNQPVRTTPLTGQSLVNQLPENTPTQYYLSSFRDVPNASSSATASTAATTLDTLYLVPLAITNRVIINRVNGVASTGSMIGRAAIYERKDKTIFQKLATTEINVLDIPAVIETVILDPQKQYFFAGVYGDTGAMAGNTGISIAGFASANIKASVSFTFTSAATLLPSTVNATVTSSLGGWRVPSVLYYNSRVSGI